MPNPLSDLALVGLLTGGTVAAGAVAVAVASSSSSSSAPATPPPQDITITLGAVTWPVAVPPGSTVEFQPPSGSTTMPTLGSFSGGIAAGTDATSIVCSASAGSCVVSWSGINLTLSYDGVGSLGPSQAATNSVSFNAGQWYSFQITFANALGTSVYFDSVTSVLEQTLGAPSGTFQIQTPIQDATGGQRSTGTSVVANVYCNSAVTLNVEPNPNDVMAPPTTAISVGPWQPPQQSLTSFVAGTVYTLALSFVQAMGSAVYEPTVQAYLDGLLDSSGQSHPGSFLVFKPVYNTSGGKRAGATNVTALAGCLSSQTLNLVPNATATSGVTIVSFTSPTEWTITSQSAVFAIPSGVATSMVVNPPSGGTLFPTAVPDGTGVTAAYMEGSSYKLSLSGEAGNVQIMWSDQSGQQYTTTYTFTPI